MDWVVYILRCADDTYYTGITNDLDARVKAHNDGTGAKYTKPRTPVKIVYQEECLDRSAASKREYAIKRLSRNDKTELIKTGTGL
jgi:putative endonuclease